MSKLDGPSDPVVSAEKVRLLEEKVAAYDKDIVDVLAEIELVKQEEEVVPVHVLHLGKDRDLA